MVSPVSPAKISNSVPTAMAASASATSSLSTGLLDCPPELLTMIGEYLDRRSVMSLTQTCRQLRNTRNMHKKLQNFTVRESETGWARQLEFNKITGSDSKYSSHIKTLTIIGLVNSRSMWDCFIRPPGHEGRIWNFGEVPPMCDVVDPLTIITTESSYGGILASDLATTRAVIMQCKMSERLSQKYGNCIAGLENSEIEKYRSATVRRAIDFIKVLDVNTVDRCPNLTRLNVGSSVPFELFCQKMSSNGYFDPQDEDSTIFCPNLVSFHMKPSPVVPRLSILNFLLIRPYVKEITYDYDAYMQGLAKKEKNSLPGKTLVVRVDRPRISTTPSRHELGASSATITKLIYDCQLYGDRGPFSMQRVMENINHFGSKNLKELELTGYNRNSRTGLNYLKLAKLSEFEKLESLHFHDSYLGFNGYFVEDIEARKLAYDKISCDDQDDAQEYINSVIRRNKDNDQYDGYLKWDDLTDQDAALPKPTYTIAQQTVIVSPAMTSDDLKKLLPPNLKTLTFQTDDSGHHFLVKILQKRARDEKFLHNLQSIRLKSKFPPYNGFYNACEGQGIQFTQLTSTPEEYMSEVYVYIRKDTLRV